MCNSAETAALEPVVSLDQALLLLGDNAIFRMVCSIGFGSALTVAPGYDTEANGLWTHSLAAAVGAEYLAGMGGYGNFSPPTAFTAGLLHDIGKAVISRALTPRDRVEIRAKITGQSMSRTEAEKAVLGANHCEVGACLLELWALPEPIIEAVANHHCPVVEPAIKLSAVVYLANCAAHLSTSGPNWEAQAETAKQMAAQTLGMDPDTVGDMFSGIHEAMDALVHLVAAA
jgi:putative nucleotidyltransferase with HDIG domain